MLSVTAKSSSDNRFLHRIRQSIQKNRVLGLDNFAKLVYKVLFQIQTLLQTCIFLVLNWLFERKKYIEQNHPNLIVWKTTPLLKSQPLEISFYFLTFILVTLLISCHAPICRLISGPSKLDNLRLLTPILLEICHDAFMLLRGLKDHLTQRNKSKMKMSKSFQILASVMYRS